MSPVEPVDLPGLERAIDTACELIDRLRADRHYFLEYLKAIVQTAEADPKAEDRGYAEIGLWLIDLCRETIAKAEGRAE